MERKWWMEQIGYQIYPKSFKDTNDDGIGDIPGIIEKLDYLQDLGATLVWICPVYDSPMFDNGYDISNYEGIWPTFGTMEDMDTLIQEAKKRGISLMMDLVVNHCSDQHEWFKQAIQDKNSKYRNYFIFKKGENGKLPCNWRSVFGGSVWEEVPGEKGTYYYHTFAKQQPDLNWECAELRAEIIGMINRWLERGITGYRVDAINFIKKGEFVDREPDGADGLANCFDLMRNVPGIEDFYKELREKAFDLHDCATVSETVGVGYDIIDTVVGDKGCFSMMFDFNYTNIDVENEEYFRRRNWTVEELKNLIYLSQKEIQKVGWSSPFFENHDLPRSLQKNIKDKEYQNEVGAKALAVLFFHLRGTPFIYQGQELGMPNAIRSSIEEFDDLNAHSMYQRSLQEGFSKEESLEFVNLRSRDNARTPMPWSSAPYGGFSSVEPWIKMNESYTTINVESQIHDENSVYSFYKKMIQLRKDNIESLVYGIFEEYDCGNETVISYTRTGDKQFIVLVNLSAQEQPIKSIEGNVVLNNYATLDKILKPYQAVVLER